MPCPRTVLLSACLDPEWTGQRHALIMAHLRTCQICAAELDSLRCLSAGLRALPSPLLDKDLSCGRAAPRFVWHPGWRGWLAWVPASVAVAASLLAGVGLGNLSGSPGVPAQSVSVAVRLDFFDPVPPGGLCIAADLCETMQEQS